MGDVKLIRAKVGILVPTNPEKKDSLVRPVQKGTLCLIPTDFKLAKEKYEEVNLKNKSK